MKNFLLPVLSVSVLLSVTFPISATQLVDSTEVLHEIVVTETAAKAPVTLLPLDVRILNSDIIDNSTETNLLPVLQNRIPGMFVTERGLAGYGVSGGAAGAVSIRGVGGGNKVLFMIDGQPQWAGVFGHALPDTYVTNDVERVEVVSGPSSLLYGSGAMGGSVNLITRRAHREGFSGSLRLSAGSYGSQQYGAKAAFKRNRLGAFLAASYESSDGNRKGMGYWLANQYVSANYRFSNHWETGINLMLTQTKADNPGSVFRSKPLDMWARQLRVTSSLFIKNRFSRSFGGFQAYYNYGHHDIDDGLDNNDNPRTYLFHSKDFNMGATIYQTIIPWKQNNLSVGIDFKHWGGRAYNTSKTDRTESPIVDRHVNEVAGYAMMQQALLHDKVSLNAGLRLEHSSQFGNEWVPQAGIVVNPSAHNRLKMEYGKGFRSPTIRELYMYAPRNPDLLPESMNNFEIEFRQWFLNRRLEAGLALYYINGEDMIQPLVVDGKMKNVNTGKFINKGFEADASFYINSLWTMTANYAYLHTDTRILGAPENKIFVEIDYTPARWQFSIDMMNIFGLWTEETKESYTLLNFRAAYSLPLRNPITLFVKGDNLTATEYQINYGFPMPRATVMAGIEWTF